MLLLADSSINVAIPVVIGAFLGAVGSLIFLMRARGFVKVEAEGQVHARRAAVRRVSTVYAVIAWLCFGVAIALGDTAVIVLTGSMVVLACVGLVRIFGRRGSGASGDREIRDGPPT